MTPLPYFVTLNWNTTGLLKEMMESVEATTPEPHRWIIVDNGSDSDQWRELQAFLGNTQVIGAFDLDDGVVGVYETGKMGVTLARSPTNLGCIHGHNLAFKIARTLSQGNPHEIIMIDTDVVITEQGWLSQVRAWGDAKLEVGIIGLEHGEHETCAGAVFLDPSGNWYIHEGQTNEARPVQGESVGLGLALIRWPVLRASLRFDPDYVMYYKQDDDLCFQVRANLGLEAWVHPIGCIHWGSGSLKANVYECGDAHGWDEFDETKQANQATFVRKWQWALDHRRAKLEQERIHLEHIEKIMANRRKNDVEQ